VEQVEFTKPRDALREAGATVEVLSLTSDPVQGFNHLDKGDTFRWTGRSRRRASTTTTPCCCPEASRIRTSCVDKDATSFVHDFFAEGKPVASICHGPWTLIDAGVVQGRTMTSWPSLQTDLRNAGANWVDEEVVVDQGLVSSRKPDDLPAFCAKLVEELAEGKHDEQARSAA
jgi:protease I